MGNNHAYRQRMAVVSNKWTWVLIETMLRELAKRIEG